MDLLTDLLQQAGLRRRLLAQRHLGPSAALRFPCAKSMGLHVVTQGRVYLHAPAFEAPMLLTAGDIAVMARGCEHVLSAQPSWQVAELATVAPGPNEPGPAAAEVASSQGALASQAGEAGRLPASTVISGAYQLWNDPLHPFLREMPPWFVLRADELPRLGPLALAVSLLDAEVKQPALGADTIVHGLLDVIFTYLLRDMLNRHPAGAAGFGQAVRDPQVRQAVALMHGDCAAPWTLDTLASGAGLSRTGLAERFRLAMGDTPLSYLRSLRMQKAMQLLSESERPLEQVAREVGYQDAFGFSKVFKREVGLAPREFRRTDQADRQLTWRFQAG